MVGEHEKTPRKRPRSQHATGKRTSQTQANRPATGATDARKLITMKEAITLLKTSRPTFYRWLRTGKIKGMKVGRQWRFYREDIERFLTGKEPRVDAPSGLGALNKTLLDRLKALGGKDFSGSDASDVRRTVNLMIALAVAMRASDIHLAASLREGEDVAVGTLRYRIDGALHEVAEFPNRLLPAVVEQWKRMAACNVGERVRSQDGRIMLEVPAAGGQLDLRVCFVPATLGEALTVRLLSKEAVHFEIDRLDYAPYDKVRLVRALESPWGLIVVTGPTGCGKTTVLYSCLMHLNRPEIKILTVEDPVEYVLPRMVQIPIRPDAGVTFGMAMRSMLRSDPDVLMIGEVRDYESLQVSHQAALTGHLVLTTLHADTAAGALKRMVDMGSPPFLVSDSVKLALSQRLVRLLCPDCSVEREPQTEHLKRAEELARAGGVEWEVLPRAFREPVGCAKCAKTGYRGRNVIAETLETTPEIVAALSRGASAEEMQAIAVQQGMTTMAADGVRRAANADTSLAEVFRALGTRRV